MKTQYWFTLLALLPLSLSAAPPKVNFRMTALEDAVEPATTHWCWFSDILKMRPSSKPDEPSVATIVLSEKTIDVEEAKSFDFCQKVFLNLTKLDQQQTRDEIAGIILEMPCKPGAEIEIEFGSTRRPGIEKEFPRIKHTHVVNKVNIGGCMDDMPDLCSFPSKITRWDSQSLVIDHEKMMRAFKDCREALIKKVDKEGLREKWEAEKKAKATPKPQAEGEKP